MVNYYKRIGRARRRNFLDRLGGFSAVTWLIIITVLISVLVFILTGIYCVPVEGGVLETCKVFDLFALKPGNILQGQYLWTLLTHMFVHGGIGHLLINMFVLFSLGGLCERIIGKKRFVWFYLISGVFAGLLSVVLSGAFGLSDLGARIFGSPEIFMVGASGAIFAIAGLYVVLLPRLKFMIIFLPFFGFPGYILIPAVLFGVWLLSVIFNWPVGNVAHFGGFLVGIVYGVYLRRKYKRKVKMLQRMFRA
ncbi:hypothetical protein CMI45_00475 [Candidatus Pacearchaeota archaeon]|nr:hypothetical protein [Candidatus Pacearchaeota archaeon]MAG37848.1 hypothetical protein [Candidatus Pacearchaeota archaeon]|tara:strand:- start:464 stop:1213 length:750 start_codon:yes stop_codon:yes gene_type:complete